MMCTFIPVTVKYLSEQLLDKRNLCVPTLIECQGWYIDDYRQPDQLNEL